MSLDSTVSNNRKKWVAALRSGNYQQAVGHLKTNTGYCCHGVLCDLEDSNKWSISSIGSIYIYDTYFGSLPPKYIADKVGISYNQSTLLADMNDDGRTFGEIANYIEGLPVPLD